MNPKPSDAGRWMNCAGSVSITDHVAPLQPTESDNEARLLGTATHYVGQLMLGSGMTDGSPLIGLECGDTGIIADDDIIEAASQYARYILQSYRGATLNIEQELPFVEGKVCKPDCWLQHGNEIVIFEAKYGRTLVEVFENWQMVSYLKAILDYLGVNPVAAQHMFVTFVVIQPHASHVDGPVRSWRVRASNALNYINDLIVQYQSIVQGNNTCKTGIWCNGCEGRHACASFEKAVFAAIEYAETLQVNDLDNSALSTEIRILRRAKKMVEKRLGALETQGEYLVRAGETLPFLTPQNAQGRKKWKADADVDQILAMAEILEIEGIEKPRQLITPTQAINKKFPADIVNKYSFIPNNGLKLVEDDGLRARMIFQQL